MDIFDFREHLIGDYADYVRSFIHIRDARIRDQVEGALKDGRLWPQPLLQLNPSFEPGGSLDALVREGVLHSRTPEVFRVGKSVVDPRGRPLPAHRQLRATDTEAEQLV
ncbi:MAG: hypothetical protein U5K81_11610 [Trueperaceae bacterium]|nr:hypothetical protein [Trueperaceae bacterium]